MRGGAVAGPGPLIEILRINTDLLHNPFHGVSDEHAAQRIHGANLAAFLAACSMSRITSVRWPCCGGSSGTPP
jgi:hypothetical protein